MRASKLLISSSNMTMTGAHSPDLEGSGIISRTKELEVNKRDDAEDLSRGTVV